VNEDQFSTAASDVFGRPLVNSTASHKAGLLQSSADAKSKQPWLIGVLSFMFPWVGSVYDWLASLWAKISDWIAGWKGVDPGAFLSKISVDSAIAACNQFSELFAAGNASKITDVISDVTKTAENLSADDIRDVFAAFSATKFNSFDDIVSLMGILKKEVVDG